MSYPHAQVAKPNAKVVSRGWTGKGVAQQMPGWCYAAAEQMVQRAFGRTLTQVEIAHNCLLALGRVGQEPARKYYQTLLPYLQQEKVPDLGWKFVSGIVNKDKDLMTILTKEFGIPPFTGLGSVRGNAPNPAEIVRTIDDGGLVVIGTKYHYKVVYGYSSDAHGNVVSYMMFNPLDNGTDRPSTSYEDMAIAIEETWYVTG